MQAAADPTIDLTFKRHADELRGMWQTRLLAEAIEVNGARARPRHKLGMCVVSILSQNFDDAMPIMLALYGVRTPPAGGLVSPVLVSAAKIAKTGQVMADIIGRDGRRYKNQVLFKSETELQSAFRRLADRLKFGDADRVEMFAAIKRWVVCDYRLDPTMNSADPDAKRLVN